MCLESTNYAEHKNSFSTITCHPNQTLSFKRLDLLLPADSHIRWVVLLTWAVLSSPQRSSYLCLWSPGRRAGGGLSWHGLGSALCGPSQVSGSLAPPTKAGTRERVEIRKASGGPGLDSAHSLLPHSVSHSQSPGRPRLEGRGGGERLHLLLGGAPRGWFQGGAENFGCQCVYVSVHTHGGTLVNTRKLCPPVHTAVCPFGSSDLGTSCRSG